MAPPQFNPQQYPPPPNQQVSVQQKPAQDYVEKYKRLKRKYFELDEVSVIRKLRPFPCNPSVFSHPLTPGGDVCLLQKFKETESELLRSSERTFLMRREQRSVSTHIPFLTPRPLISLAVFVASSSQHTASSSIASSSSNNKCPKTHHAPKPMLSKHDLALFLGLYCQKRLRIIFGPTCVSRSRNHLPKIPNLTLSITPVM